MSARPEERRTAREYNRWLRASAFTRALLRLFGGWPRAWLLNTPALDLPREVGLKPQHRVLDLGCGDGGVARLLAERAGLVHAPVGVDLSTVMLRIAAQNGGRRRPVALVAAAASRLPFADATFDLIVSAHLFRRLEDDTLFRVLLEAQRVLRPGGILLGWEFAPTSSRRLDRFHHWLLTRRVQTANLRGYGTLAPYALYAGFQHADRHVPRLPFLFPPIPRVVVMLQKARIASEPAPDEPCLTERFAARDR